MELVIESKSIYTDPDGSVVTREPHAEIKLSTRLDTVRVKDLSELTERSSDYGIVSSTSGADPITNITSQTFSIGGQEIVFDLSYEIYNIVNSADQLIEMPYIKLNRAAMGGSSTAESESGGKAAVMADVTVRPRAMTRVTTVTDETLYDVNVRFSLDVESVNTKDDGKQTLNFSVNYVGVVETTTELKDPESSLSYSWQVRGGSSSGRSPFVKTGDMMELWLNQRSRYSDEYGNVSTSSPRAVVKVSASRDTIWASDKDEFSKLEELMLRSVPGTETTAAQKFCCGDQEISIDWSCQTAEAPLPYCELSPVTLKSVTAERLIDATVPGKQADVYDVTATFIQSFTTKGVTGGDREETVEYVVKYICAVEVFLVKTEYRRDYAWLEAEYNLPLRSHLIVYRDRTYSNGETYTDTFRSGNTAIESGVSSSSDYDSDEVILGNGDKIILRDYPNVWYDTGGGYKCSSTDVPDLSLVNKVVHIMNEWPHHDADGTHLENYTLMGYGNPYNPDDPTPGWYFERIECRSYVNHTYDNDVYALRRYMISTSFFDRFLCVDDTIIDFRDMNMTRKWDYRVIDLPSTPTRGPAKVNILDCKGHYLGRDFYFSVTDTIYQFKN